MRAPMLRYFPVLLALAAAPAAAQIVVVPLDPVEGTEVLPEDPNNPGEFLPLDPNNPGEFVPLDPNAPGGFIPLDPVDPGEVIPLDPVPEGDPMLLEELPPGSVVGQDVTTVAEDVVATGTGARLKGLDKLAGTVTDMTPAAGDTVGLGWLQITLGECRYPVDNPTGDAYAWLVIREEPGEAPVFEGWMVASSPALNALDHARFDVWVTSCTTE